MDTTTTSTNTSRQLQKERTREHLFNVAMGLYDARGFDAVSIDDIVKEAQVSRGTFYFHFPTQDDVLLEAIRRGETHIVGRLRALRSSASLKKVLTTTTEAFAEAWGARRELLPYAGAVALRRIAGVASVRDNDALRLELQARVERGLAKGELESAIPPAMLADIFLLNVFAALMAWGKTGEPPLPVMMAAMIHLFLHGVSG